ncbi:phosphoglycerate mutase-like protein [Cenococcum geophilum]
MSPTLILIRHAQALHNVENNIPDPALSELGIKQCQTLQENLKNLPLANEVKLIVVSPMRRTLQTATLCLGWLIERGVPVMPDAGWQESSDSPCDTGSNLSTLSAEFNTLDFSAVDSVYPNKTTPESNPYLFTKIAVLARGQACLRALYNRPEKVIAVVSHSAFLRCAVSGTRYANADYRIFDFEEIGRETDGQPAKFSLKEWAETEARGGGMGRSERGRAQIKEQDFPRVREEIVHEMPE